jgi:hypothetical protein
VKFIPFIRKSRQNLEQKSFAPVLQSNVYLDNTGNIIGTTFTTNEDAIRSNSSVNSILSKQSSIISEANIAITEKSEDKDLITTNKDALQFIKWLESPNCYPSPTNRHEIIKYILGENFKSGISGVVFTFEKVVSIQTWENIKLAQTIDLYDNKIAGKVRYDVGIDEFTSLIFSQDNIDYPGLFVSERGSKIHVLFVSGNYNIKKARYQSPFEDMIQYIHLQNHLINFSSAFYKNSCFPSQIVQLTYKNLDHTKPIGVNQEKEFRAAVAAVKNQLEQSKSSKNAGKIIVPEHPSLEIEVKPLNVPTNAEDTTRYDSWVSTKILGFLDGGSKSAFEGENEYSNNAIVKLEDLYDGTFRIFQTEVIEKLNTFMISLFTVMKVKVDLSKIKLSIDISGIKLYQKQSKTELRELVKDSILQINEGRVKLGEITEEYADLQKIPAGDALIIEYGKSKVNVPSSQEENTEN